MVPDGQTLCVYVCVDCPAHLTWHAQPCFLYNLCTFGPLLGWDLLSGKFNLLCLYYFLFLIALYIYIYICMSWPDFHFDHVLQARAVSTDGLRPSFYTINAVVYVVQVKNLARDCSCGHHSRLNFFFWGHGCCVQPVSIFILYCLAHVEKLEFMVCQSIQPSSQKHTIRAVKIGYPT